jgi:hypothetical protein
MVGIFVSLLLHSTQSPAEYTFKNIKPAFFIERDKASLSRLGVVAAKDSARPDNASRWIWVMPDGATIGVKTVDGSESTVLGFLREFDVAPRPVRLEVLLNRKDWDVQSKSVIDTSNNCTTRFGSLEVGLQIAVRPRLNADGTVTMFMEIEKPQEQKIQMVVRLLGGQSYRFRSQDGHVHLDGKGKIDFRPSYELDRLLQSNFEIEIKAEIPKDHSKS